MLDLPGLLVEIFLGVVFMATFLGLLYLRKTLHTGEPGLSKVLLSGAIVVSFLSILALSIYLGSRYL